MAVNNGLDDYGHLGWAVHTFFTEYNCTDKLTNVIFESRLTDHFGWSRHLIQALWDEALGGEMHLIK
jgi:hypothetical protein